MDTAQAKLSLAESNLDEIDADKQDQYLSQLKLVHIDPTGDRLCIEDSSDLENVYKLV